MGSWLVGEDSVCAKFAHVADKGILMLLIVFRSIFPVTKVAVNGFCCKTS
jgi:hypothetical protein